MPQLSNGLVCVCGSGRPQFEWAGRRDGRRRRWKEVATADLSFSLSKNGGTAPRPSGNTHLTYSQVMAHKMDLLRVYVPLSRMVYYLILLPLCTFMYERTM